MIRHLCWCVVVGCCVRTFGTRCLVFGDTLFLIMDSQVCVCVCVCVCVSNFASGSVCVCLLRVRGLVLLVHLHGPAPSVFWRCPSLAVGDPLVIRLALWNVGTNGINSRRAGFEMRSYHRR